MMRKKLGEILIASGVVTQQDLDAALGDQTAGEPARVGDLLVALGKISPLQLARALSQQHAIPFIQLPPVTAEVLATVPADFQQRHRLVPFRASADAVSVAVADPSNTDALEALRAMLGKRVNRYVAAGDEIDAIHLGAFGGAPLDMPSVAPVTARASAAPTAGELFGTNELGDASAATPLGDELFSAFDLSSPDTGQGAPSQGGPPPAPAQSFELDDVAFEEAAPAGPPPAPAASFELDDVAFEDAPPGEAPPPPAPSFELDAEAFEEVAPAGPPPAPAVSFELDEPPLDAGGGRAPSSSPSGTFELTSAMEEPTFELDAPVSESSGSFDVSLSGPSGAFTTTAAPGPALDAPPAIGPSRVIPPVVAPRPPAPPPAVAPSRPPAPPPVAPAAAVPPPIRPAAPRAAPSSVAPVPAAAPMPDWLGASPGPATASSPSALAQAATAVAPAGLVLSPGSWSGKLDDVAPSRLVVGAVKVLVAKGLVTEAELLEVLGKKG